MPFNGSGVFSRVYSWVIDAGNSLPISASRMDTDSNDIASALNNCLTRDGQGKPTANFNVNGFQIKNMAAAVAGTDAATLQQLFSQGAPATLASAATVDIGGQNTVAVEISGTTTVTSFGTNYNGPRFLRFTGSLILTHNSTTLNLPGAANITTQAGDTCIAYPNSAANGWNVTQYQVYQQAPSTPGLVLLSSQTVSAASQAVFTSNITSKFLAYKIIGIDVTPSAGGNTLFMRVSEDGGATYKSGAGNYIYTLAYSDSTPTGGNGGSSSATSISLAVNVGLANAGQSLNFEMTMFNPAGSVKNKQLSADVSYATQAGTVQRNDVMGFYAGSTNAINAIQFAMSSGNLSGTFHLYGVQ